MMSDINELIRDYLQNLAPHIAKRQAAMLLKVALAKLEYKQSQIDSLMLEYCPDEMTESQKAEWEKNQVWPLDN